MKFLVAVIPFDVYDDVLLYDTVEAANEGEVMLGVAKAILGEYFEEKKQMLAEDFNGNMTEFFDQEINTDEGLDACAFIYSLDKQKMVYEGNGVSRQRIL